MSEPHRVQLSRKKGWRMPENTVSVARPGRWGNPFKVAEYGRERAVLNHRLDLQGKAAIGALNLAPLAGKNLACWCPLCDAHKGGKPFGVECRDCSPCHSDVLGDLANPADACGGTHA